MLVENMLEFINKKNKYNLLRMDKKEVFYEHRIVNLYRIKIKLCKLNNKYLLEILI